MAVDRTPVLKRCRSLGMDPIYLGIDKKSTRQLKRANRKVSEYGLQLKEKQKAKFIYGVLEKPFRNYYKKADRMKGQTGENLMIMLETRLDNVLFRMGFARTRKEARQIVDHKHVLVNGKCVNIPSYLVKAGDSIEIKEKCKGSERYKGILEVTGGRLRRSPRGKGKSFANLFFLESEVTRMAIYSCNISNVSRAKGSSSCATFSYISGEKVRDERLGKTFRYGREERVILTETLLPEGAPVEFQNPVVLFNAIEKYENTDNARTAKKIMVALPKEFDLTMQKKVVDEFIEKQITSRGYACSYAIHHDKENMNPHAHILIANRQIDKKTGEWTAKRKMEYALDEQGARIPIIDPSTGKQKVDKRNRKQWKRINAEQNVLDKKEVLQNMRASWAEVCNQYLDQEHQIDHRSHETRGIDQEPTIHEGYEARAIEASGKASDRCQINRDIKERNELLTQVQEQLKVLEEEIQKLKEQEKGEERNERIRELLRRREAAKSVGGITDGERTTAQSDTDDFLRKLEAQERASKEKRSDHRSEQTTAGIKQYSYRSRKQTFGAEQEVKGRDEQVEEYDEEFEQ